jgi:uncharacterized cupin superfamily protein
MAGLSESFRALVRRALGLVDDALPTYRPQVDRMALYRAEVQTCAADGSTVDVTPESAHLPAMQGVPVRVGIPGAVATMHPGAVVLVGWEAADPARPYAVPAWEAGAGTIKLTLSADTRLTIEGGEVDVNAGAGSAVNINSGAGASVVVNGGINGVARAIVDTAGPYPISGGALRFKG